MDKLLTAQEEAELGSALRTQLEQLLVAPAQVTLAGELWRRGGRRNRQRRSGLAAAVMVVAAAVAVPLAVTGRVTHRTTDTLVTSPQAQTDQSANRPPSALEQTITPTTLSGALASGYHEQVQSFARDGDRIDTPVQVFAGPDGSSFYTLTVSSSQAQIGPVKGPTDEVCTITPDTAGHLAGSHGSLGCDGLAATAAPELFTNADTPSPTSTTYYWLLPVSSAYVTYSYDGHLLAWENTPNGIAALVVARPAAFDGDYSAWHTAPLGTLTAHTDAGAITLQVPAPRIPGDDLKSSATAPTKPPIDGHS